MIVIFSIEGDKSTDEVIDWLDYYGAIWERINAEDFGKGNLHQFISKISFLNKECKVVWYRKWSSAFLLNDDTHFSISEKLDLIKEFKEYSNFLFNSLKNAYWLNNPSNLNLDKLTQLIIAKENGLNVPCSLYTSSLDELKYFLNKKKFIITKNLDANIIRHRQGETFMGYTREININDVQGVSDKFYPTLFQEKIEKDYEIRAFFIEGTIFSMAILSQNDQRTKIDFRKYNRQKPNRNVPYSLPNHIDAKIKNLMLALNINCGSIDLIKSRSGKYIFLEVNPLGQFGMTSKPCNYHIEKRIAEHLISKEHK